MASLLSYMGRIGLSLLLSYSLVDAQTVQQDSSGKAGANSQETGLREKPPADSTITLQQPSMRYDLVNLAKVILRAPNEMPLTTQNGVDFGYFRTRVEGEKTIKSFSIESAEDTIYVTYAYHNPSKPTPEDSLGIKLKDPTSETFFPNKGLSWSAITNRPRRFLQTNPNIPAIEVRVDAFLYTGLIKRVSNALKQGFPFGE